MSLESVRAFVAERAPDISVIESTQSSATGPLAAAAYGVEPARIAKTLSLRVGERVVLIGTSTGALLFMAWALVQYGRTRELTAVT